MVVNAAEEQPGEGQPRTGLTVIVTEESRLTQNLPRELGSCHSVSVQQDQRPRKKFTHTSQGPNTGRSLFRVFKEIVAAVRMEIQGSTFTFAVDGDKFGRRGSSIRESNGRHIAAVKTARREVT